MAQIAGNRTEGFPCWVDLSAPNVDEAVEFYREVMGWDFAETGPAYGGYRMASRAGRQAAGIGPLQGESPAAWTVYFAADDADAFTDRAKQSGATVLASTFDVPGQGRMSVVADPTGAVFGTWQAFDHHGFEAAAEPGFFSWAEVNTADASRARDFYTQLLGASARDMPDSPTSYYMLSKDGEMLCGIMQMNEQWAGIPPHWMIYFEVADLAAAIASAKELGGTVAVEPFDTPFGRVAVLGDRAKASFSLLQK